MPLVADALLVQRPCYWDCHTTLTAKQRERAVLAIYHCDDALRGWGYTPLYELHGDLLWRKAQERDDDSYRGVAVRFGECIYRRLVGSLVHEVLHASFGDTTKANYGILFGLPYGVPKDVPEKDEQAYLDAFNFGEARAFVGVAPLARRRFGIDWEPKTARDIGTYCFTGGNALVPVGSRYRPVAHIDPQAHAERYAARGRRLEAEARAWFTEENLARTIAAIDEAAARGRASRPKAYPDPAVVARVAPTKVGRNDECPCGSSRKVKACCGAGAGQGAMSPYYAR
jgi:hypothetical protein